MTGPRDYAKDAEKYAERATHYLLRAIEEAENGHDGRTRRCVVAADIASGIANMVAALASQVAPESESTAIALAYAEQARATAAKALQVGDHDA